MTGSLRRILSRSRACAGDWREGWMGWVSSSHWSIRTEKDSQARVEQSRLEGMERPLAHLGLGYRVRRPESRRRNEGKTAKRRRKCLTAIASQILIQLLIISEMNMMMRVIRPPTACRFHLRRLEDALAPGHRGSNIIWRWTRYIPGHPSIPHRIRFRMHTLCLLRICICIIFSILHRIRMDIIVITITTTTTRRYYIRLCWVSQRHERRNPNTLLGRSRVRGIWTSKLQSCGIRMRNSTTRRWAVSCKKGMSVFKYLFFSDTLSYLAIDAAATPFWKLVRWA